MPDNCAGVCVVGTGEFAVVPAGRLENLVYASAQASFFLIGVALALCTSYHLELRRVDSRWFPEGIEYDNTFPRQ